MRNLEAIEKDLTAAREALSQVKGTSAEVYSRIVGYYRSVRNWNKGKREEYGERRLYRLNEDGPGLASSSPSFSNLKPVTKGEMRLLLFVRAACPRCPPAKAAAGRLGIPVETVSADTSEGIAEAARRGVLSTPTAILFSPGGEELGRAMDAEAIGRLLEADDTDCAEPVAV
jgi:ribonucleoside-triphosphate reductase